MREQRPQQRRNARFCPRVAVNRTVFLTGKFYEALQQKKPIVALVDGDKPKSELKTLIDQYRLGICYEEATKGLENEPEKGKRCDVCFYLRLKKGATEYGYKKINFSRWNRAN